MKKLGCCLIAFSLFAITACNNKSQPGGGTDRANKFTLEGPSGTTTIAPGESQTVQVKLNRGKDFKEAVKLKAEPPSGIEATMNEAAVTAADKGDISMKIAAGKNTAPGEYTVRVTGTPDKGEATHLDVKVKVAGSADNVKLALKGPSSATTIKQGDAQTIKITLAPADKYTGEVRLDAKAPPGIKAELTPATLRSADKGEANLLVNVAKTAELGEHTIQITGASDAAVVQPAEVKIKVVAP